MSFRALPKVAIAIAQGPVLPMPPACEARFEWVETARLVIDTRYQRDVGAASLVHIERIARAFDWKKFTPVICSGVEGGRFAVIDGQHRAAAAHSRGIARVPAWVFTLSDRDQAASFAAINGQVVPMTAIAVYKAARAAGEAWALAVERAAEAAGVTVLVYPKPLKAMAPRETMAVASLKEGIGRHGSSVVIRALKAIADHPKPFPGALNQHMVKAAIWLSARWGPSLIEGLAAIDIAAEVKASAGGAAEAGISRAAYLRASLDDLLRERDLVPSGAQHQLPDDGGTRMAAE